MPDPDFELRRGSGSILLAQPAFLPSAISSFSPQNKGEVGGGGGGAGSSPRSATDNGLPDSTVCTIDRQNAVVKWKEF